MLAKEGTIESIKEQAYVPVSRLVKAFKGNRIHNIRAGGSKE